MSMKSAFRTARRCHPLSLSTSLSTYSLQPPSKLSTSSSISSSSFYRAFSSSSSLSPPGSMQDEYTTLTSTGTKFTLPSLTLSSGETLLNPRITYNSYGTLNASGSNAVVVCHALTGNSDLQSWWGEMLGSGKPFNTDDDYIICLTVLGTCYGSSNPKDVNPSCARGVECYNMDFPMVSVSDTVKFQIKCLESLGVTSIKSVIGGSFGGMQVLEYMYQTIPSSPTSSSSSSLSSSSTIKLRSAMPISCTLKHSPWQIAISQIQRAAITSDVTWSNGTGDALSGLSVARQIGMISYRSSPAYTKKFTSRDVPGEVESYLSYQGNKFLSRFDSQTYYNLTLQMDSHDVYQNKRPADWLKSITYPVTVLGISSDILYPISDQMDVFNALNSNPDPIKHKIASGEVLNLKRNVFIEVESDAGHDGFLLEQVEVGKGIGELLGRVDLD